MNQHTGERPVRVRFAPSPTGTLHVGGVRTALYNYLFARKQKGVFVLRIDDTDLERSEKRYEADIISQLDWLGLVWDEGPELGGDFGPYRQSERLSLYTEASDKLLNKKAAYRDSDNTVRLKYPAGFKDVVVADLICGDCRFTVESLGPEPVLLRADGTPTYHLASVVDDLAMKISHVIRGQDHLTNTAKHILISNALEDGGKLPEFAHLPLILGVDGSKLSKRNSDGLISVSEFSDAGYLPEALINFLLLLGWSHPDGEEVIDLETAINAFDLTRVRHAAATFDPKKLHWLNGLWLRSLPTNDLAKRSKRYLEEWEESVGKMPSNTWLTALDKLKDSVHLLSEVKGIAGLLLSSDVSLSKEAEAFLNDSGKQNALREICRTWQQLLSQLELSPGTDALSEAEFSQIMALLKKQVDPAISKDKKSLFQALRIAIMGDVSGPELKMLVPLIKREVLLLRVEQVLKLI